MSAGKRRHLVSIERPTASAANAYGETTDTWSEYCQAYVGIIPQSAREYVAAQGVRADMTHLLRMLYTDGVGVTNQMRVKFNNRYLHIVSVLNPAERNVELQLVCVEEV